MRFRALRSWINTDSQLLFEIEDTVEKVLSYLQAKDAYIYSQLPIPPHHKQIEDILVTIIYGFANLDHNMIRRYFDDMLDLEVKEEYREELHHLTRIYVEKLRVAFQITAQHRDQLEVGVFGNFIAVRSHETNIKRRMYLNCVPDHIDKVVDSLIKLMLKGLKFEFKFPLFEKLSPHMLVKADKIIVYYGDDSHTHNTLKVWSKSMADFFHSDAPRFTRQEIEGVGFAYQPLPEHHQYAREHPDESVSFSKFMSIVIAEHLYKWCLKHQKIPSERDFSDVAREIRYELDYNYKFPL